MKLNADNNNNSDDKIKMNMNGEQSESSVSLTLTKSAHKRYSAKCLVLFYLFCFALMMIIIAIAISLKTKRENIQNYSPEQIHIAIGDDISQMVVVWSTRMNPGEAIVRYGTDCNQLKHVRGMSKELDSNGRIQFIHYVTLTHLMPQTYYCYSVGSHYVWSDKYEFISLPNGFDQPISVALFGDMGLENGRSIPSLINNAINRSFDVIIDVGDIAYTLYAFQGRMGDAFMRAIEPFAARVPFMVVPGNHEYACYGSRCPSDFGVSFETRFKMPKSTDNSRYTFNLGPALFVAINTEVYFENEVTNLEASIEQREWLEQVLYNANKPENRARHPWIIVLGHRPLYCSSQSECFGGVTAHYKFGPNIAGSLYDIDDILYKYGVDIAFWGHEHNYERMTPVYNQKVYGAVQQNVYHNPRATIHITSGAAGMHSQNEPFFNTPPPWSAFRSSAYGYTRFLILNATHIYIEQIDVDRNDTVIDYVWIIQQIHMPFQIKPINIRY